MEEPDMKTQIMFVVCMLFTFSAHARVELFMDKKHAVSWKQVKISAYDRGQFKNCEEMGIVHSQAFWGGFSTKKGMLKRMKKQAGKVGATDILLKDTGHGDYSGSNVGNGVVFYCPKK
jgi:hypothetical protein